MKEVSRSLVPAMSEGEWAFGNCIIQTFISIAINYITGHKIYTDSIITEFDIVH